MGLAYGLGGFVLITGIAIMALGKFSTQGFSCPSDFANINTTGTLGNAQYCLNDKCYTGNNATFCNATSRTSAVDPSGVNTSVQYGITQLSSSGLLGWMGAIIAIVIGVFFLQYFMGQKKGQHY